MGLAHSWVAVRTADRTAVLTDLGLEVAPDGRGIRNFLVAELPGPWVLLVRRDYDWAFKTAQRLSRHGLTIACGEEEHVMASAACAYDGGALVWRVVYDPDIDPPELQVTGAPPKLAEIRAGLEAEQAEHDNKEDELSVSFIFEGPPKVAEAVVGFSAGDAFCESLQSEALRKIRKPGLLQRLFSGSRSP